MNHAEELQVVREELAVKRRELERKESAPIEGRVADEGRYMIELVRLQNQVHELWTEERRLAALVKEEEEE